MNHGPDKFATTRWSLIQKAKDVSAPEHHAALQDLCSNYWQPLYWFVRSRVSDPDKAADLTQGFFTHLLEKRILESVSSERGNFRSFLMACIRNFMNNEHDREQALKRGGDHIHVSFDVATAESRFSVSSKEPAPEAVFEKLWATALLEKVHQRLDDANVTHKNDLQQRLKQFLTLDPDSANYQQLQNDFGLSKVAARVAVYRLRERFRKLLREEIATTLGEDEAVEDEIACLLKALKREF